MASPKGVAIQKKQPWITTLPLAARDDGGHESCKLFLHNSLEDEFITVVTSDNMDVADKILPKINKIGNVLVKTVRKENREIGVKVIQKLRTAGKKISSKSIKDAIVASKMVLTNERSAQVFLAQRN